MISSKLFIHNPIKIILLVSIFMLAACATATFPYKSTRADNLTFSVPELESDFLSKMESGFFARTEASLHIFYADNDCNKTYKGTIKISKEGAIASAGLETDRIVYLRLWVENGNTTRSREYAFQPQPDYHYTIEYIEKNKAYGIDLRKRHKSSGDVSEFSVNTWDVCAT